MTNWISYQAAVDMVAAVARVDKVAYRYRTYIASLLHLVETRDIETTATQWEVWHGNGWRSALGSDGKAYREMLIHTLCASEKQELDGSHLCHHDPLTGSFEMRIYGGAGDKLNLDIRCVGLQFDGDALSEVYGRNSSNDVRHPAPADVYLSPFMRIMLAAVEKFEITAELNPRLTKDELVAHFRGQKLPDGTTLSNNQAEMMATFIRPVEAMKGGQKRVGGTL